MVGAGHHTVTYLGARRAEGTHNIWAGNVDHYHWHPLLGVTWGPSWGPCPPMAAEIFQMTFIRQNKPSEGRLHLPRKHLSSQPGTWLLVLQQLLCITAAVLCLVPGPPAAAPGDLLEMHIQGPAPDLMNQARWGAGPPGDSENTGTQRRRQWKMHKS